MSHAKNKIDWCLKKAKQELKANRKHRGIIKTTPNNKEAKEHIEKAEHNLQAAIIMEEEGFPDWAISAIFYTIYHCFLGIITKFGYESRNQECTIALIEWLKEEENILIEKELIQTLKNVEEEETQLRTIISLRENFQYGTLTELDEDRLKELKKLCKLAIYQTKEIILST